MKYVMSDIHGRYDKFLAMLDKISFNKDDTLYILGDIIDRGNQSLEMIQYVMITPNIKMLLGNHEDMMLGWCVDQDREMCDIWMCNGGHTTWNQIVQIPIMEQERILWWMKSLPLYYIVDDKYFLVHAGYHKDYKDRQKSKQFMVWARQEFYGYSAETDYTVIFGHTPTWYLKQGDPTIWKEDNKIGIDCGAISRKGQLACLRLDDMQEFYV